MQHNNRYQKKYEIKIYIVVIQQIYCFFFHEFDRTKLTLTHLHIRLCQAVTNCPRM